VPGPEVGRPAPDFSWSADDGTKETLGDLKGKVVILVFWSPTCEYCREELKTLESIHRDYSEEVVIVGVSRSLGGTKPSFLNVIDDGQVFMNFRVRIMPTIFFVGRDGIILERHEGVLGVQDIKSVLDGML